MSSRGFTVTRNYLGLATAWRAEFKRGTPRGRVVGVNAEMDALPGIGHGCGHNLIAMAGVGIALALRAALEKHDVPGTVILLGTPGAWGQLDSEFCDASPTMCPSFPHPLGRRALQPRKVAPASRSSWTGAPIRTWISASCMWQPPFASFPSFSCARGGP